MGVVEPKLPSKKPSCGTKKPTNSGLDCGLKRERERERKGPRLTFIPHPTVAHRLLLGCASVSESEKVTLSSVRSARHSPRQRRTSSSSPSCTGRRAEHVERAVKAIHVGNTKGENRLYSFPFSFRHGNGARLCPTRVFDRYAFARTRGRRVHDADTALQSLVPGNALPLLDKCGRELDYLCLVRGTAAEIGDDLPDLEIDSWSQLPWFGNQNGSQESRAGRDSRP